jgi:DNA polymerase III delta subunit
MDDGSPAVYVMTMIARQIRLLLMANDLMARGEAQDQIGRRIRLSGWVLNKTLQQARRMSRENLEYMHSRLVETDLMLKTKPIDEQLALEMLVAELTTRRY